MRRGPPHLLLRAIVAPVTAVSTVVLFATGVALLVADKTQGTIVGLHKASFVVWCGALTVHVLTRLRRLTSILLSSSPGRGLRVAVVATTLVAGALLAATTLPAADRLQDQATALVAVDVR